MPRVSAWKILASTLIPACLGFAQESAPIGIVRGDLLAWSGTVARGELVFRNADARVFQCSFDERSYFERSNQRISVATLNRGDRVEVLADHKIGSGICYARIVQMVDAEPFKTAARPRARPATYRSASDLFAPRGDMTFAGIILKVSPEELLLRTRANGRRIILLRPDTRFLGEGQSLEFGSLLVNTRVFIRAGKNLDDQIEAYQVIWGDILEPVITPEN
jgi:hypothetical protein